ncbi:5-oxoprolinase subunit PxpA [Fimbriiglobus ruber]|uniref:5-oxoprolinase subunit PxpA n=1 Tax=Fimbriiglobus ruber TaxID=1908690 RepID=UPI000B4B42BC|nr:5-oxoprolinase subunit PxpA [Fimbriiglobus ruber]
MEIDLNADLGEGVGADAELMPLVTSANISCGAHAGNPNTIRAALRLAGTRVAVGAHPGYADPEFFGRRDVPMSQLSVFNLCAYQIGALSGLALADKQKVRYVKPHGALYHAACRDNDAALSVVLAAQMFELSVVALPDSVLETLCNRYSVPFVAEGFADRRYRADCSLVPRGEPGAMVESPTEAVAQVEWLVRDKKVRTICVHGDTPHAVAFAKAVREELLRRGFTLKAFA